MKRIASALALLALFHPTLAPAADSALDELQGKWSVQKTNEEGRVYSQHLEFTQDKLTFELRREDGEVRFVAKAKVKTDKAGPLKTFTLSDIEAGRSSTELEPVDDQRSSVYTLRDGNLVIASNFDRERDNERPSIDVYTRSASKRASSADAMPEKLLGTWDMELTIGDNTIDYQLAIEKADGGLQATLISPRSGKHKFKSIEYKDGQLRMEIDREIEGRETTLTYRGKLTGGALAGKVTAEGFEQGADWRATK
jgi:uncharacterized protein (TIGR03067 family)